MLTRRASVGFPSGEAWLQTAGVTGVAASRGLRINNSAAVLQAAIEGHGVALARRTVTCGAQANIVEEGVVARRT